MSDCQMVTEPAHLVYDGEVYLGVNCVCFGLSGRMPQKERFVLLRETANGYEYVSTVLTHEDAQSLAGADRIEQVDLYEQRDGTIGLVGTPMKEQGGKTLHMGCYFMEFDDFKNGTLKRDSQGRPAVKFVIKDSNSQPRGQGACTYDKNYDGGVLIIRRVMPPASKKGVVFSLLRTGIHP
ncbi:hypothetical protein V7x_43480 [Crateriforma conspicua]|uniref:Uncharacterized protein n=1 Tax=Crateriforma conspicua TaxID=2527996 RepID=A0A5C6FQ78_9PLAN|nr:hypothetical protein [Crateriforma conspicua]TWU62613.1 hypothetical protein V7x_43480 [Crateriforma conspicua]